MVSGSLSSQPQRNTRPHAAITERRFLIKDSWRSAKRSSIPALGHCAMVSYNRKALHAVVIARPGNCSMICSMLDLLQFDNRYLRALPADAEQGSRRRQVARACYSRVQPTAVAKPQLVAYSREVAELIGLDEADCVSARFAEVFTGNALLPGMDPVATCYGGHQFGNWAGQLGDGRAIVLAEVHAAAARHCPLPALPRLRRARC